MYKFQLTDPHFLPHCGCDLEFSLDSGELLTIVGENGVGKSTLVQRFWEKRSIPMTLIEQKALDVFYDRRLIKIKELLLSAREDRLDQSFFLNLWSRFGLIHKEDRFHSTLSGGEGQALKLCLGLAQKAHIYLLDEPSQFLDPSIKKILDEVISDLIKMNKSILMIEHDYEWLKVPNTFIELGIHEEKLVKVRTWNT